MQDPIGEMRRILDFLDIEWTREVADRMQEWIGGNPQNKYGRHRYGLRDFGLDPEEIEDRFKAYRERFDIGRENGPELRG